MTCEVNYNLFSSPFNINLSVYSFIFLQNYYYKLILVAIEKDLFNSDLLQKII